MIKMEALQSGFGRNVSKYGVVKDTEETKAEEDEETKEQVIDLGESIEEEKK